MILEKINLSEEGYYELVLVIDYKNYYLTLGKIPTTKYAINVPDPYNDFSYAILEDVVFIDTHNEFYIYFPKNQYMANQNKNPELFECVDIIKSPYTSRMTCYHFVAKIKNKIRIFNFGLKIIEVFHVLTNDDRKFDIEAIYDVYNNYDKFINTCYKIPHSFFNIYNRDVLTLIRGYL
jgi:hypothetical protein